MNGAERRALGLDGYQHPALYEEAPGRAEELLPALLGVEGVGSRRSAPDGGP